MPHTQWVAPIALFVVSAVILAACDDDSSTKTATQKMTTTTNDAPANITTTGSYDQPRQVSLGEPISVSCSETSNETCMTVTFTAIRAHSSCDAESTTGQYPNIIAVDATANRTAVIDSDFTSPFRSFPWSAATTDNHVVDVSPSDPCVMSSDQLRFMQAELPGTTTTGTLYVGTADDVNRLIFSPNHQGPYILSVS